MQPSRWAGPVVTELGAFLAAVEPPVYVGGGSMPADQQTGRIVIAPRSGVGLKEWLALIRIWLPRKPLPGGAYRIPPSLPADRKVRQLSYTFVPLISTTEADYGAMGAIVAGAAKDLPITVMVVADQQNGISLAQHAGCGERNLVGGFREWPL
ncbi:hypothetical protein [Sorangium sp. So ce385]|uniref:hypothetical protein n=1 Tax=Sorangium sp. So ce385 TaxID=3133308 RepID=UPI003F5C4D00